MPHKANPEILSFETQTFWDCTLMVPIEKGRHNGTKLYTRLQSENLPINRMTAHSICAIMWPQKEVAYMAQAKAGKIIGGKDLNIERLDPFYKESNIQYLEKIKQDMDDETAHFGEHDLIETESE